MHRPSSSDQWSYRSSDQRYTTWLRYVYSPRYISKVVLINSNVCLTVTDRQDKQTKTDTNRCVCVSVCVCVCVCFEKKTWNLQHKTNISPSIFSKKCYYIRSRYLQIDNEKECSGKRWLCLKIDFVCVVCVCFVCTHRAFEVFNMFVCVCECIPTHAHTVTYTRLYYCIAHTYSHIHIHIQYIHTQWYTNDWLLLLIFCFLLLILLKLLLLLCFIHSINTVIYNIILDSSDVVRPFSCCW